jgi:hypothetical protein
MGEKSTDEGNGVFPRSRSFHGTLTGGSRLHPEARPLARRGGHRAGAWSIRITSRARSRRTATTSSDRAVS